MKRRALIIGGTGFIGKHITAALVKSGYECTVVSRHTRPESTEWLQLDRATLEVSYQHWDCIIDNIAYTGADVQNTLTLFPNAKHFILNSTISVYRYWPRQKTPIKENQVDHMFRPKEEDLTNSHWKYAREKLDAEAQLLRSARSHTILRPTMVIGSNDVTGRIQWHLDHIRYGKAIRIPENDFRFHLVSPEDVGEAFALAAEKQATGAFNLASTEPVTLDEFLRLAGMALGKSPVISESGDISPFEFSCDWRLSLKRATQALDWHPSPLSRVIERSLTY